ncbi:MAG: DUF4124 domain-containing protein [Methylotenera sp.]|nr:DUF4124 domain-containing protein [Methylotenera sp.]
MRIGILLLCIVLAPTLASAEIYKWKDKDGKIRYSDIPPPSNVKHESMTGKKLPKPTGLPPLSEVEGDATATNKQEVNTQLAPGEERKSDEKKTVGDSKESKPLSKEEAAAKRAKDAEAKKKADLEKDTAKKIHKENCKTARNNLITYTNGGRISKLNEQGEREYMSDAEINQGKIDAQKEVDKFCE